MPKFRIYWGIDGSTEGSDVIEAEDQSEADMESYSRLHQMLTERGFHRAEPTED